MVVVSEPEMIDPSKTREQRRKDAKARAAAMKPEQVDELRAQHVGKQPTTSGSRKQSGASALIYGTMDVVSMPIYDEWGPEPFMTGPSNDFLFPIGAGQSFNTNGALPRQLRQGGWVYLRAGNNLVARVQYLGAERRERRIEHVPSPDGHEDRGAGWVLAVDPATWERCTVRLESPSESGNGYRYYMLDTGCPVWTRTSG